MNTLLENTTIDWIEIESIEPLSEREEAVCIAIDSPEKLYITDDGIITHNTTVEGEQSAASPQSLSDTDVKAWKERGVTALPETKHFEADNGDVIGPALFSPSPILNHGTPHEIEDNKFKLEKIGTGEGAQAYGWGIYLAEKLGVSKFYRDMAGRARSMLHIDGKYYNEKPRELESDVDRLIASAWHSVPRNQRTKAGLVKELQSSFQKAGEESKQGYKEAISKAESDAIEVNRPGNLYTVKLDSDTDKFLDWDKNMHDQSEFVKSLLFPKSEDVRKWNDRADIELLKSLNGEPNESDKYDHIPVPSGSAIYDKLVKKTGSPEAASKYLQSLGIDGIRYLDQDSRNGDVVWKSNRDQYTTSYLPTDGLDSIGDEARIALIHEARIALILTSGNLQQAIRRLRNTADMRDARGALQQKAADALERGDLAPVAQTYNYVVFDPSKLKITHKNGEEVSFGESTPLYSARPDISDESRAMDLAANRPFEDLPKEDQDLIERVAHHQAQAVPVHRDDQTRYTEANFPANHSLSYEQWDKAGRLLTSDGKPSHAKNEQQYRLVRTPLFKRWFGDWEARQNAQMPRRAATFKQAAAKAESFINKLVTNRETGMEATVSSNSLGKMLSGKAAAQSISSEAHSMAVANADHLFQNAHLLETHPDKNGNPDVAAIHRFVAPMELNGEYVPVKLTVKELKSATQGKRIYSVESVDMATPAEKRVEGAGKAATDSRVPQSNSAGVGDNLRAWWESVNPENASKVVHADTGEPMVVYHGTDARLKFSKADRQVWMSADPLVAEHYAGFNRKILMPFYVKSRHPLEVESAEDVIDVLRKQGFDQGKLDAIADNLGDNARFSWGWVQEGGKEIVHALKSEGYDSVIASDDYLNVDEKSPLFEQEGYGDYSHKSLVIFDPNQIKSIDNNGAFSKSGSILYSARPYSDEEKTENFKKWSNNAPLVPSDKAESYPFKSGEKVVVEGFHGTQRPDRVGEFFDPKRATSGPMPFFTSDGEMGGRYAEGKKDTSLFYEDANYANWFKFKQAGMRKAVSIDRAWNYLSPETKARISDLAPRVKTDYETGENIELGDESHNSGIGGFDYHIKEAKGNPLDALVQEWLSSGALLNDEERFLDVLKKAGVPMSDVTFDSPRAVKSAVFPVHIKMQSPLVTNDIPKNVIDALKQAAKHDRSKAQQGGADQWDKNRITLREWVEEALHPETEEIASRAWTRIPDKATAVFKSLGYDGIIDDGGKYHPTKHKVYIPFEQGQVKSIFNRGSYDESKRNMLYSARPHDPNQKDFDFAGHQDLGKPSAQGDLFGGQGALPRHESESQTQGELTLRDQAWQPRMRREGEAPREYERQTQADYVHLLQHRLAREKATNASSASETQKTLNEERERLEQMEKQDGVGKAIANPRSLIDEASQMDMRNLKTANPLPAFEINPALLSGEEKRIAAHTDALRGKINNELDAASHGKEVDPNKVGNLLKAYKNGMGAIADAYDRQTDLFDSQNPLHGDEGDGGRHGVQGEPATGGAGNAHDDTPFETPSRQLPAEQTEPAGEDAEKTKAQLFAENQNLAYFFANKYRNIPNVDMEDAKQEARIGLFKAAQGYDPEKGKFSTYAAQAIKNRLNSLYKTHLDQANHEESLNTPAFGEEEGGDERQDYVQDASQDVAGNVARNETSKLMDEAIAKLAPKARVIAEGVRNGKTYEQIGKELGVTKQGAQQMGENVFRAIRNFLKSKGMSDYNASEGVLMAARPQEGDERQPELHAARPHEFGFDFNDINFSPIETARGRLQDSKIATGDQKRTLLDQFIGGKNWQEAGQAAGLSGDRLNKAIRETLTETQNLSGLTDKEFSETLPGAIWNSPANEIPYADEQFYWLHEPSQIALKSGWNKVLIRVPCGYGEQAWTFTFAPVKKDAANHRWIEDTSLSFAMQPSAIANPKSKVGG